MSTEQAAELPDIVDRLRGGVFGLNRIPLCEEAAAQIAALRADLAESFERGRQQVIQQEQLLQPLSDDAMIDLFESEGLADSPSVLLLHRVFRLAERAHNIT